MLIRFGNMGPETFLSGWIAEPITQSEATRRANQSKLTMKEDHVKATQAFTSPDAMMMVVHFPAQGKSTKGGKSGLVWREHYLDLTPEQFGYAVRQSMQNGILDVRAETLPYWREQHTRRLLFVAQTPVALIQVVLRFNI